MKRLIFYAKKMGIVIIYITVHLSTRTHNMYYWFLWWFWKIRFLLTKKHMYYRKYRQTHVLYQIHISCYVYIDKHIYYTKLPCVLKEKKVKSTETTPAVQKCPYPRRLTWKHSGSWQRKPPDTKGSTSSRYSWLLALPW